MRKLFASITQFVEFTIEAYKDDPKWIVPLCMSLTSIVISLIVIYRCVFVIGI